MESLEMLAEVLTLATSDEKDRKLAYDVLISFHVWMSEMTDKSEESVNEAIRHAMAAHTTDY